MLAIQFKTHIKSIWNSSNFSHQLISSKYLLLKNWKFIANYFKINLKSTKFFLNRFKNLWKIYSKCTSNIFKSFSKSIQYSYQISLKFISNRFENVSKLKSNRFEIVCKSILNLYKINLNSSNFLIYFTTWILIKAEHREGLYQF